MAVVGSPLSTPVHPYNQPSLQVKNWRPWWPHLVLEAGEDIRGIPQVLWTAKLGNPQIQWNFGCENCLWYFMIQNKGGFSSKLCLIATRYQKKTRCVDAATPRFDPYDSEIPRSLWKGKSSLWNKVLPQQYSKASQRKLMGWWRVCDFDLGPYDNV